MGAAQEWVGEAALRLHGLGNSVMRAGPRPIFDCGESGSTLRFLIPIALAVCGGGEFTGRGRLMERPLGPYFDIFREKGIAYGQRDGALWIEGRLPPGIYRLPGNVSSQFVTGLLYALPLLAGDSELQLTTPLESRGYVDMTLAALNTFGIAVEATGSGYFIPGRQRYRSGAVQVEADWSQAAFWYAAAALGSAVEVQGMEMSSAQGDKVIVDLCRRLRDTGEQVVDVSGCPDLVPPLAAVAAVRRGATHLVHAGRLRLKESDRLASVHSTLTAFGVQAEEGADSLTIHGADRLRGGGMVACCRDHRIAMMAAVLATRCDSPVELEGAECVAKSYPDFWEDYKRLGGRVQ